MSHPGLSARRGAHCTAVRLTVVRGPGLLRFPVTTSCPTERCDRSANLQTRADTMTAVLAASWVLGLQGPYIL